MSLIDVNEHKETLVDFIQYNEPKRKFLKVLSEFRFNSENKYSNEDYEYKILDLACSELKEIDYSTFKDKIIIETEGPDLTLSQIPSSADRVVINDKVFSQSQILPNEAKNSKFLSDLLEQFIALGLQKERLYELFGIHSENDPTQVFEILTQEYLVLKNAQQLGFVLLYAKEFEESIEDFKVETLDDKEWELKYNYYTKTLSFIGKDYLLKPQYSDVNKIIHLPIEISDSDNQILQLPYFLENKFVCPSLKPDLSEEEKLAFIDFLYSEWEKDMNKQKIRSIVWDKIEETETESILGFNPNHSVFPSKYACESEVLPDYLIIWIGNDETKINFLSDIGVWTETSVIVELRKYLSEEIKEFHNNRLAQETRFNEDETNLFNSFVWIKENEINIKSAEQFETFKKVVEIINENRTDYGDLEIIEEFDFEELKENSPEWNELFYEDWKQISDVAIFLYEGELPKTISLDEIDDYEFYSFYSGNAVVDAENNIYINQNTDVKKEIRKLELEENNEFNFDGLWQSRMEILEKENAQLKQSNVNIYGTNFDDEDEAEFRQIYKEGYTRVKAHWRSLPNRGRLNFNDYFLKSIENDLQQYNGALLGTEFSTDISKNDQKEANREAKEIVKEKLEGEGFEFKEDIGTYSTINGVFKDDIEFPLVVKSYKYQVEPLKIAANEWIQLMKPNSMFWIHFGNRKLGCLKLYELLRNQDKLTITFSTENLDVEDRLDKFAELLHYFGNVHFDFHSVKTTDYSVAKNLDDYRFDERRNEDDLSSDDEELL